MCWKKVVYMEYTTTNIRKIDHVVLTTANPHECIAFYKQLGFCVVDVGSRYELYAGDFKINVHKEGHELKPNAHVALPGTLDLCMEVCIDIQVFHEALKKQGMKVSDIGNKHGAQGEMQSFYLRDPDQNLLEFCSYQ